MGNRLPVVRGVCEREREVPWEEAGRGQCMGAWGGGGEEKIREEGGRGQCMGTWEGGGEEKIRPEDKDMRHEQSVLFTGCALVGLGA